MSSLLQVPNSLGWLQRVCRRMSSDVSFVDLYMDRSVPSPKSGWISWRSKNKLEADLKVTPGKSPGYTCRQNICSFSCLLAVCCVLFSPDCAGLSYFEHKCFRIRTTSNDIFTWSLVQCLLSIPVMEIIACLRKKGLPCIGRWSKNEKVVHKQRRWTIQTLLHCQLMLHDGSSPQLLLYKLFSLLQRCVSACVS